MSVSGARGHDLLPVAHFFKRAQAVAQTRGCFKLEVLRRRFHLSADTCRQLVVMPLKEHDRLVHKSPVLLVRNARADAHALAELVVDARPVPADILGKLRLQVGSRNVEVTISMTSRATCLPL